MDNSRLPSVGRGRDRRLDRVYYGKDWPRIRRAKLAKNPWCETVLEDGTVCGQPATDVDHEIPHVAGEPHDWANLVSKCHGCHSRKTVAKDGGFGRAKRYETRNLKQDERSASAD